MKVLTYQPYADRLACAARECYLTLRAARLNRRRLSAGSGG